MDGVAGIPPPAPDGAPMSRPALWLALALAPLTACGEDRDRDRDHDDNDEDVLTAEVEDGACGDRSLEDADVIVHQLVDLGYTEFDDETFWDGSHDQVEVVTTAEQWAAATARWGADGGLRPDFALDAVFVHPWTYDGCSDGPRYETWAFEDAVRLDIEWGREENCDLGMPMLDLIVVQHDGRADIGVCP
jgi:hypothetical protein